MLDGKVALVTGGSRGIGRAIALALAKAGAVVALTYRDNADAANAVVAEIGSAGGTAAAWRMDVRDRAQVADVLSSVVARFGGLHVLANNAGINKPTDFDQVTDADWDEIVGVNLKGPFVVSQLALPLMQQSGGGSIVMTGSVSGQYGGPRTAHYAASKAGLVGLARSMARELASRGITVNVVAPGPIDTEMMAAAGEDRLAELTATVPAGRLGEPDEVAAAVDGVDADLVDPEGPQSQSAENRLEEVINYEISRTTKTETIEAGRIKKLSVAVVVDGLYADAGDGTRTYSPRSQEEMDQIRSLVRSAIGFDQKRGDTVEVANLQFAHFRDAQAGIQQQDDDR